MLHLGIFPSSFRDIYKCHKKVRLNQENLFRNVQTHISSNTTLHDVELIPLLSIKYAYFVRNKMFHGEIPDSTFKIHKNNEDIEIDRLNDILSTLIFELLNNNDMLR